MKLKIFLTGASGFIGKNFIEQRKIKYSIFSPTHKQLDLTDRMSVNRYFQNNGPFDVVLHFANRGGKRSDTHTPDILKTNLVMFFNLLKNKRHFKKMIYTGTGAEYDKSRGIKLVKETDFAKHIPQDEHSFSKYLCSQLTEEAENVYCLRLFGIFGPYEDYRLRFISNMLCKYIAKLPLTVRQNAYFDYLCINDFITILDYFFVTKPKHKFYNVGSGKRISLLSLAEKINKLNEYSLPLRVKQKALNKEYTCNNSRLLGELKDFKFTHIDDSIRELYNWYKKNWSNVDIQWLNN